MATVYSLVCWGGLTGKVVSISATTDVVTLTNHGLRNGTKLWPSGTLPSELNTSTPVYARSTGTNTFTLHTSAAGAIVNTGQILFAGSSTYAAVTLKSDLVADPSSALSAYGLSDLSRWGGTRIYDGIVSFNNGSTGATAFDSEVVEIGESFIERYTSAAVTINRTAASCLVTTKINGVRTGGFHNGQIGSIGTGVGYQFIGQSGGVGFIISGYRTELEGFTYYAPASSSGGVSISKPTSGLRNIIFTSPSVGASYYGIRLAAALTYAINCVVIKYFYGIYWEPSCPGVMFGNCIALGNGTGVKPAGATGQNGYLYNNISVGNTTNWATLPTGIEGASNNAGESGNSPYAVGTGATSITMATTDFVDYVSYDLRPASTSSPQVDSGVEYFNAYGLDIKDSERPSYNNGGAEYYDVGPYEFDKGFGPHPSTDSRGLAFTGLVAGSKVKVFETGTDTEKFSTASSGTSETWSENVSGSLTVDYVIMKAGYLPIRVTGVSVTAGPSGVQTVPVSQVVARWYQASSGLTINTNCFANASTKKFGLTTTSTLQNLASYLLEQWVALGDTGEAYANKPFPIEANGPNSFTWLDGWEADLSTYANTITNLSRDGMRYLNTSGVMTASWCALLSAGVPSGLQVRYQQVEGNAPTNAAVTGNIDQLIQIYGDSTHGNFDYRGYMVAKVQEQGYDQAEVDVVAQYGNLEDQLYVIALLPLSNGVAAANPTVSSVTITDHGASPVTWNSKAFSITITDSGTTSGETIMQWIRRAMDVGGTFQGKDAFNWHDLIQVNGDKYKGVRGAIYGDTGAPLKGVRVLRGTDAHPDFTIHTADDGSVVSTTPPAQATASILANSRVQLYNVTTATELDNVFVTGTTYSNTLSSGVSVGDTLRIRVCKIGYDEAEAFAVWTASGCSFIVSQDSSTVYSAWGIDGSTVTEFTLDTTGAVEIDANDADGATTKTRLGAWYSHILTTADGIRYLFGAMSFLSTAAIRINVDVLDLQIENTNSTTALRFTDLDVRLYRSDGTSVIAPTSYSIHNDYSGVPDVVNVGGSALTPSESAKLMGLPDASTVAAATLSAASTTPIHADVQKMNSADVIGDGSASDPWRGVGVSP